MKKFIKAMFVFVIIVFPFLYVSEKYFINFFNFNYLSQKSWAVFSAFWQSGGVIKTKQDYGLLFSLLFMPILFISIWRYFYKKSFLSLFSYPIDKYNAYIIKKEGENSKRIILKNLGRQVQKKDQEIHDLKPDYNASKKTSQSIREAVREKLTNN